METIPATCLAPELPSAQPRASTNSHHAAQLQIPRDMSRRFSNSDAPRRIPISGPPQLHHFLTSSDPSPQPDDSHRGSSSLSARPGPRRYSSADCTQRSQQRAGLEGAVFSAVVSDFSVLDHSLPEIREHKRARLSPGPGPARSVSEHVVDLRRSGRPRGRSLTTTQGKPQGHQVDQRRLAASDRFSRVGANHATGVVSVEPFPRLGERTSNADLGRGGIEPAWAVSGATGGRLSPTAPSTSSSSSNTSSPHSDASSQKTADTDLSIQEHQVAGDETPIAPTPVAPHRGFHGGAPVGAQGGRGSASNPDRYGTPEMPRGTAKLPHLPAGDLTPRVSNQGHPKHLPRAEKLPMSGYELLASSISATGVASSSTAARGRASTFLGSPPPPKRYDSRRHSSASFISVPPGALEEEVMVKPIYRRFEALSHRLLLQLQDELGELEEQLHRLDTTDTQTRRLQSSILPSSRRAESLAGGELQCHKSDILGKIGLKLAEYNRLLSSFTSTRDLPAPSLADVSDYRTYLATRRPISEVETRFLDSTDDLVTLAKPPTNDGDSSSSSSNRSSSAGNNNDVGRRRQAAPEYLQSLRITDEQPMVTPIPGTMHGNSWRHKRASLGSGGSQSSAASTTSPRLFATRPGSSSISPRFATRPGGSSLEPLRHLHLQHPLLSPRLPPSPLKEMHSSTSSPSPREERESEEEPGREAGEKKKAASRHLVLYLVVTMAVAVAVPMLSFSAVRGFVGRMAVVLLAGLSVAGYVAYSGQDARAVVGHGGSDVVYSAAVYAAVMAVAAGVTS